MCLLEIIILLLVAVGSGHCSEAQTPEPYELTELYNVVLKERNATMTVHQHISWAQGVHMGGSHNPSLDDALGYVETTGERSYRFITYLKTINIIRDHPDVCGICL